MTLAAGAPSPAPAPAAGARSADPGVLLMALGAAVAARAVTGTGVFAGVLAGAALLSGWRPAAPSARAAAWGVLGAVVLVVGPLGRHLAGAGGSAPGRVGALPWVFGVTAVVCAEEAFLRGAVWRACERWKGSGAALGVTTVAFAVLHVPQYGWRALPLDVAVGLVLGGLRIASGSVLAPTVAHVAADWAGWWLA